MVGFLMLLVAGPPFARSPIRVDPRMSHDARRSVYGAWPWAANFFQASAKALELQATISHRPIAFVPESSSLGRCVT